MKMLVPRPICPCATAQLTQLPDLTRGDAWPLEQITHHLDCMNAGDMRIGQQLLLSGTSSLYPNPMSMSAHGQNSLDPCAGSCMWPEQRGRGTHLQHDFDCEDRGETNVKVSKNLGTEAQELDEIWVTWEMLQCVQTTWPCGFAIHSVDWEAHLAQQSLQTQCQEDS